MQTGVSIGCHGQVSLEGTEKSTSMKQGFCSGPMAQEAPYGPML